MKIGDKKMGRPLEGIKIIEVAMWAFVPVAGSLLSDLGADVIKIEPPTGDPIRGFAPAKMARFRSSYRGKATTVAKNPSPSI
jgi:crotonobetainyl-CoA:carnitine CoA-transferase CaiB-like acyl-CoA transferase